GTQSHLTKKAVLHAPSCIMSRFAFCSHREKRIMDLTPFITTTGADEERPVRHDGWSRERKARFLDRLAETGSVAAACARVGMSRNSAYNLRKKPHAESFAAAWDAALGMPIRKVTVHDLEFLAYHGLVKPYFRGGKYIGSRPKPQASALLR